MHDATNAGNYGNNTNESIVELNMKERKRKAKLRHRVDVKESS